MMIEPARRTLGLEEYYFSRKLKELDRLNAERAGQQVDPTGGVAREEHRLQVPGFIHQ